ncbi:MAG: FAD-binding oxidoreductase [Ferruginibacter sp.]|nr:FAD-binding oxidoreductase [Ferruginibacter sp.]
MKKINTLVVGQGIAGTLVAFMLHRHKIPFMVIDPGETNTSSRIAAGMFTPVSGKRKTIHPDVLLQIPFAIKICREIEQLLGAAILHLHNIYQVFNSVTEKNDLLSKSATAEFEKYILFNPPALPNIKQETGACEITHSGWVDCGLLITRFAEWLKQNEALTEAAFVHQELETGNKLMEYHGMQFSKIIFCEGYGAIHNPFFHNQNIIPCKGDMLTILYDHPVTDRIVKKDGIYLIPAGNNLFRAGSTYGWNNNSTQPDESGKKLIEDRLDAMLENKYTTIDHRVAIRPTTQNREVIVRQHPKHTGMFMLNGLGTKGILQGPWWAKRVVELCEGQ